MNKIDYEARKKVYEEAIQKYGASAQILMAIEEMSELTKVLCKMFRDDSAESLSQGFSITEEAAEECADVTIMLEQLRLIMGMNDDVCRYMDYKIRRLAGRLGMNLSAPAADVAPVRHGRWERASKSLMVCSACGNCVVDDQISGMFNCPNCGAKMDTEEDHE